MIKNATKLNKKRRRALWAKALESGKYTQATGMLRNDIGYCCLGVACDVFRKATGRGKWVNKGFGGFLLDGRLRDAVLPSTVADWFGLGNPNPRLGEDSIEATELNDRLNTDFHQIAQMVRAL